MKVLDPGHSYELDSLDAGIDWPPNRLLFVKREGEGYPGNVGHHPGTNIQDVLRVLIDRVQYLDNQIPDGENKIVLNDLRSALFSLELRAAKRHGRILGISQREIEKHPVCPKCGHIGCGGSCNER